LLVGYKQTIARRVAVGFPHPDAYIYTDDGEERDWVTGFLRGMVLRAEMWRSRAEVDEDCRMFIRAIYTLAIGEVDGEESSTSRDRAAFFRKLPAILLNLYREWRGLEPATASRAPLSRNAWDDLTEHSRVPVRVGPKIGRNEPCPCGSGKKFKRCCGGITAGN
jgi:uncharacterized protein YecA (UPF0149 family)